MFENSIQEYGPELRSIREQIATRPHPEVVRFFAIWKASALYLFLYINLIIDVSYRSKIGEENRRIIEARKHGRTATPNKVGSRQASVGISDEEKSIVNVKTDGRGTAFTCAACRTRQSNVWWKAPKGLNSPVLCDDCGVKWRKYGDLNAKVPKDDSMASKRGVEKREGTPMSAPTAKRMKVCEFYTKMGANSKMTFRSSICQLRSNHWLSTSTVNVANDLVPWVRLSNASNVACRSMQEAVVPFQVVPQWMLLRLKPGYVRSAKMKRL